MLEPHPPEENRGEANMEISMYIYIYMGVSKNRGGPPKWMVYNGKPYFWKHPYIYIYHKHGTVYGILTYRLVNLYGKGKVNRPYIESLGV